MIDLKKYPQDVEKFYEKAIQAVSISRKQVANSEKEPKEINLQESPETVYTYGQEPYEVSPRVRFSSIPSIYDEATEEESVDQGYESDDEEATPVVIPWRVLWDTECETFSKSVAPTFQPIQAVQRWAERNTKINKINPHGQYAKRIPKNFEGTYRRSVHVYQMYHQWRKELEELIQERKERQERDRQEHWSGLINERERQQELNLRAEEEEEREQTQKETIQREKQIIREINRVLNDLKDPSARSRYDITEEEAVQNLREARYRLDRANRCGMYGAPNSRDFQLFSLSLLTFDEWESGHTEDGRSVAEWVERIQGKEGQRAYEQATDPNRTTVSTFLHLSSDFDSLLLFAWCLYERETNKKEGAKKVADILNDESLLVMITENEEGNMTGVGLCQVTEHEEPSRVNPLTMEKIKKINILKTFGACAMVQEHLETFNAMGVPFVPSSPTVFPLVLMA